MRGKSPKERLQRTTGQVPLGRLGRPSHIAGCVLFLANELCAWPRFGAMATSLRPLLGPTLPLPADTPEIPRIALEELLANALIHRDYFIRAAVRVPVFADRVEIISPGHLPHNLTVENIRAGNSTARNPILASFAVKLLPYRGLGSGLSRVLRAWPQTEPIDDPTGNLFKAIMARPEPSRTR